MTGSLLIKKATENEVPVVHRLAKEIWHAYYPAIIGIKQVEYMLDTIYSETSLKQQFSDGHIFYVAFEDNLPVGYLSFSEKEKGSFFLNKFYIKTTKHRKGLGSQLIHQLLALLPPVYELRLTVNRMNFKAINFYFKNGFIIEDAKDFDIGNGYFMNDFIMLRKIT